MSKVLFERDGRTGRITLNRPEGMNFKARVEDVGWKQAMRERDEGTYDWTGNRPFEDPEGRDS